MKTLQVITDKFAIGLSLLCAIHCLILPLVLILLPSLSALQLDYERFHIWMLVAVLPSSIFALTMGCKQHKRYLVLVPGLIGLSLLFAAVILGEHTTGQWGEQALTILGAGFVATGHLKNFRLCQQQMHCSCSNDKS